MANAEHLDLLQQGVDVWNAWRTKQPTIMPDLAKADLSVLDLSKANLSDTDLHGADLCDFDHQCYPEKGGPVVKAAVAPPVVATKPVALRPTVPDEPIVATWRDCMGQALQNYEQSHNLHALQVATGSCQVRLEERGDENFAGVELPMPLTAPAQQGGRRNIGCGWWPVGSDADRDCAAEGRR